MKMKRLILIATAGLTMMACTRENALQVNPLSPSLERVEIKLGSSLNAATRAFTPTQGDVIATGETVYAWIDDVGDPAATPTSIAASEEVKGWTLTAAAPVNPGDPQALNSTGTTTYYFPDSGRNINVYALHGNFNYAVTEGTTTWATFSTSLTHSVEANQQTAGNYEKSDLFCAHLLDQAKTTSALQLPFKHVLAKVEVYLFRGEGVTGADLAGITSITLKDVELTGDVTLTKITPITNIASVAVPSTSNKADITMRLQTNSTGEDMTAEATPLALTFAPAGAPTAPDYNAYAFGQAIIIPQTIGDTVTPTAANFISVNLAGGGALVAKVAQAFTAGKCYKYFIVVNRTGLQLTATLTDWTDGGTTAGTAE